jgi:hypothetical protein
MHYATVYRHMGVVELIRRWRASNS